MGAIRACCYVVIYVLLLVMNQIMFMLLFVVVWCWDPNRIMPTLYVDVVVVVEHKALRYCY